MCRYILLFVFLLSISCTTNKDSKQTLFVLKDTSIGIDFNNSLTYTERFNPYTYRNFYNGGGVAIGDINNDGLDDIYFTGNLVDNKLYLNKGDWKFEDITDNAGVSCPNVWSTGATMVDINSDGLLDIYVCKSGPPGGENRHNELFINNGDLTFTEASKDYGLAIEGLSVHAAFFDYDKDGDLDTYILNNSIKSIGNFDLVKDQRTIPDETDSGNKFFRNDDGKFVDITTEAGIYSSKIGFGLGITLGDFNNDHWTDIFISNDFFEKDYLYINNKNGGFNEELEARFESISMGAMGADFADLDNDLNNDLFVTEMLPRTLERQKTKTVFESWDKQQVAKKQGYFNQYSRNTLQRNLGDGSFVELGRQAEVSATEWSWSALLFDMNNDGYRDIFVSNGIYKDLLDRDYLTYEANDETIRNRINSNEKEVIKNLIDAMPSKAVSNAVFQNHGNFEFDEVSEPWGLAEPSFSNGSAYGDLDNDGDLDLVVNNVNMPSFVYENKTDTLRNRSITIQLSQKNKNQSAIGAKVIVQYNGDKKIYNENYTSKGFQSSTPSKIHFGVGNVSKIDSLWVQWPDGISSVHTDLATNKLHILPYPSNNKNDLNSEFRTHKFVLKNIETITEHRHLENNYIDFNNERLLPQMYSNEGPALASADVNKDGITDFFIGGAKNQSGTLYLSSSDGYNKKNEPFKNDSGSEDVDAIFFDSDNDGDLDLYVCHGGKAFSPFSTELHDGYYKNENNSFIKSDLPFQKPISTAVAIASDYDNDGDIDLFVGERYKTNLYGQPGSGYILRNDRNGKFENIELNEFKNLGMITDAAWLDINNDGWQDLIITGEWMPIKIFLNNQSGFVDKSEEYGLKNSSGLWTSLELIDLDNDGDEDIVAGNVGLNNYYQPGMRMYIADFDQNGFKEQIICKEINGKYYPIVDKDELISQIPSLKKKLLYYKDYAKADVNAIFSKEVIENTFFLELNMLESTLFYNENDKFEAGKLPSEIQYAPVYAISSTMSNPDGQLELIFGGNQYMVKPQFGKYDASKGWMVKGPFNKEKNEYQVISLNIKGQIRGFDWLNYNNKRILIAAKNDDKTDFYELEK
ncbi:MAG: VCBS repeat-containing protein [Flavobacteriaceae bacterium]|nr:VCBS repeat-containing protein [Flavobacteriaceae bacterium]